MPTTKIGAKVRGSLHARKPHPLIDDQLTPKVVLLGNHHDAKHDLMRTRNPLRDLGDPKSELIANLHGLCLIPGLSQQTVHKL